MNERQRHVSVTKIENHGMSWFVAALFIIGETAGSGLVAMPSAILNTGIMGGSVLLLLLCIILGYTAHLLGNNWLLMQRRWPEYSTLHCRDPYPEMSTRAMGPVASFIASLCIYLTLFGGVSVFSLLAAKNLADILMLFEIKIHFCILLGAVGIAVWPIMMLKSPMHFWQVSIGAACSTTVAVILIILGISLDSSNCSKHAGFPEISVEGFSLGFGTLVFAYGGHPAFPTIQHDMKKPEAFKKSIIFSYSVMFLLYAPISILGYFTYGNSLTDSIILSIQTSTIRHIVNILITLHVIFSIVIIANPILQGAEQWFNVKHEFGIGRFITRSAVYFAALFTAATLPNFGVFLDLIGGSAMTCLALIMPCLFSLYLEAAEKKRDQMVSAGSTVTKDDTEMATIGDVFRLTNKRKLFTDFAIITIGVICGVVSTSHALINIFHTSVTSPCYVQLFRGHGLATQGSYIRCCGEFRNISYSGDSSICMLE